MPNARLYNTVPNVRASSFQTGRSGENPSSIIPGMPIGLLLALTYAVIPPSGLPFFSDFRPTVNVKNAVPNARITNA